MRLALAAALFASLASGQEVKRPRILGVSHIGLSAHDLQASREFYTGFLGFQEPYTLKNPDIVFFKINDRQYLEFFSEKQPGTDRLTHIALETDNAEQLRLYLASRGVTVPDKLDKGRIGNIGFFVTDPDGHRVEFVEYRPDSWSTREKGNFMDGRRLADHMSHVGIIVDSYAPAWKFYHDILGCTDAWRGSRDGKTLSWINMKVPDGDDWVEFMFYDKFPDLAQLGILHHIGLVGPDVPKAAAALEASPARKTYTKPFQVRGKQLQIYDPDGTRTEVMEPAPAGRASSTAPPLR